MQTTSSRFKVDDGTEIFVRRFLPDSGGVKGLVHIVHGMAEHGARYAHVAEALTAKGYAVYADDHRGHGETARSEEDLGYFAKTRGFERVVRDLGELIRHERSEHPNVPTFLFGHSMGSTLSQAFLMEHGDWLAGAILSGSAGKPTLLASAGRLVARLERIRLGPRGRSKLIDSLSFDAFNKQFAPNRTGFDWITRDNAEVDKYMADPRCGFSCSVELWVSLLDAMDDVVKIERLRRIPKDLPILVFSGSEDPVGGNTKGVTALLDIYARAGLRNVMHRFYRGARHETVNETNRADVIADVVGWLESKVATDVAA